MRLDKEEFYDMLERRIHDDFPKYELSRQEVAKSNNTVKCGLVVRDPDNEVAPSLRIDDYWKEYLEADDYEAAEERIYNRVRESITQAYMDSDKLGIAKKALDAMANWREHIQCSLVLLDGNDRFLSDKPYKQFLDMAKIFYLEVDNLVEDHVSRITINNEHMASLGCTLDELDAAAMANTLKRNPAEVASMSKVLSDMLGIPEEQFETEFGTQELPMYVVTNRTKCDGAAVILYHDVLDKVCDALHTDEFYLLPSSRHEVICVPANLGKDVDALRRMVHEVNMTQVPPEDLLSESVYYYERGQELQICGAEPELEEEPEEAFVPVM